MRVKGGSPVFSRSDGKSQALMENNKREEREKWLKVQVNDVLNHGKQHNIIIFDKQALIKNN